MLAQILPFLDSPASAATTERLVSSIASHGNPREVFIKLLEALSQIPWTPEATSQEEPDSDHEDEDEAQHSGDEEKPTKEVERTEAEQKQQELKAKTAENAFRRFNALMSALMTIHPRIASKVPSRFLSTELTTLLSTFVKAVEVLDRDLVTEIVGRLIEFIKLVHPKLAGRSGKKRTSTSSRPPLPPRVSTTDTIKAPTQEKATAEEGEDPEVLIQARLASSFLSHILEQYLLRTQKPHLLPSSGPHNDMPGFGGPEERVDRGLDIGWSGKYDDEVLRPHTSRVPGGKTLIDADRAQRAAQTNVWETVDEISTMCEALGVGTTELLELTQAQADGPTDDVSESGSDVGAPSSASDIPISPHGALFLLAHRLSTSPSSAPSSKPLAIFPEHSNIASSFMIYRPGQTQPAVVDAILFLGAFMLDSGGLGDIPEKVEPFMMYLQIFAVISTNAKSPQQRWLGHHHVQRCLRAHPNEAVRLAYIKDTLEHCPFESLKSAIIGVLKDEILHACTPVIQHEELSVPSTPISIFGTPIVLTDLFDVLFIDIASVFDLDRTDSEDNWRAFKDLYPRLSATVNLLRFLYLGDDVRERVGVVERGLAERVEERFLGPLRRIIEGFRKGPREEGAMECEVLWEAIERVGEVRRGHGVDL